ncbi:MAG TPA: HEAT repeat domain-containing protein [Gemmataceae bacterium]|nr:HEAT repeat domain-containing protein [Gemmataceae bacterium]
MRLSTVALVAIFAVGSPVHAQDKSTVDALIKKLNDKDPDNRLKAVEALGAIGADAKPAAYTLCVLANSDASEEVRRAATGAFGKVHPDLAPLVSTLVTKTEPAALTAAADKIGKMGPDGVAATPALIRCIDRLDRKQECDSPVVGACFRAIGEIRPADEGVTNQIGQAARLNRNAENREAGVRCLGKIGVAHADRRKDVLPYLKFSIIDTTPEVRVAALEAAASLGPDAKDLNLVIQLAAEDENAAVRKAAAAALEAIEKKK